MNMYNQDVQSQLKEKLDYELWLLDFLSKTQETFEGGSSISTITLTNRQPSTLHRVINVTDQFGSGATMEVMDAMVPLTFAASFKVLDMIFEWILEENKRAGKIQKVPWGFKEKIEKIPRVHSYYPPLLQSEPYIGDYLFALYSNMLKFRNEIVHKNKFLVLDGKLRVETIENSQLYSIELDRGELGAFVRTVVAAANLLTGVLPFGEQEDCLLKYHFDRINKLHGLREFKQAKPILENVVLKIPEEKGVFLVDVKFVREQISQIYPNANVLFNLKVIGLVNDNPSTCWFFPVDSIPKDEVFELQPDKYEEYLIPLEIG